MVHNENTSKNKFSSRKAIRKMHKVSNKIILSIHEYILFGLACKILLSCKKKGVVKPWPVPINVYH